MCRVHSPEVVDDDIEDAENQHEKGCRPLGLEADGNHDAGGKTNNGDEKPCNAPLSTEDETDEQEDEEDTSREQEANRNRRSRV